jgi:hypothetical protein
MSLETIEGPVYRGMRAAGLTLLPPAKTFVNLSVLEKAFGGKTRL